MSDSNATYLSHSELAQNHRLEMYKLYVDMADRLSARRQQTNAFFLTLHSSAIAALCVAFSTVQHIKPTWLKSMPFLLGILMCVVWLLLINSFRQVNKAKYAVIGTLEATLPVSPLSQLEWEQLGAGRDWRSYIPMTFLEMGVPVVFALAHMGLGCYFGI